MFETQKSRNKKSSEGIEIKIRTHASSKGWQNQVSTGVSVIGLHATPIVNMLLIPYAKEQ